MSSSSTPFNAPTEEDMLLYNQVWRTLRGGSLTRPAIPPEILLQITALCGWVLPYCVLTELKPVRCDAAGDKVAKQRWFASAPLKEEDLTQIAAIRLITEGKDQGRAIMPERGSYSWFEVGLERPKGRHTDRIRWKSHHNKLYGSELEMRVGPLCPAPVEDWHVGDTVGVWACAQFPGWSNEGEVGRLRFYRRFQPTSVLQ